MELWKLGSALLVILAAFAAWQWRAPHRRSAVRAPLDARDRTYADWLGSYTTLDQSKRIVLERSSGPAYQIGGAVYSRPDGAADSFSFVNNGTNVLRVSAGPQGWPVVLLRSGNSPTTKYYRDDWSEWSGAYKYNRYRPGAAATLKFGLGARTVAVSAQLPGGKRIDNVVFSLMAGPVAAGALAYAAAVPGFPDEFVVQLRKTGQRRAIEISTGGAQPLLLYSEPEPI